MVRKWRDNEGWESGGGKRMIGREMRLSGRIVEEEGSDAEEKMMRRWKNDEG